MDFGIRCTEDTLKSNDKYLDDFEAAIPARMSTGTNVKQALMSPEKSISFVGFYWNMMAKYSNGPIKKLGTTHVP